MIRNVGGCDCRDCNNGRFPDRSWWKRIWQKEVEKEIIELPIGVIKIEAGLTPPAENRKGSGVINDTPAKPIVIVRGQK